MSKILITKKLHFLLGTWYGEGSGKFPTIAAFDYGELLIFRWDGFNDLIFYEQQTWLKPNGVPAHWESGFIKPTGNMLNEFEISNSQDSGRVEVLQGQYRCNGNEHILHFKNKILNNDDRMVSSEREFKFLNNQLSYVVKMSTKDVRNHQQHLESHLVRCNSEPS